MPYEFDHFLRYAELTEVLRGYATDHADLVEMASYGTSHEGRNLWLLTVTDRATGAHDAKPAYWVDANIHATELTGGVAALHLVHHLVTRYAAGDPSVVEALRTRTFYIAPRVNPDGVERALADSPTFLRSSTRQWPWLDGHRWPGLRESDIDGDGRILTMRVPDPAGAWIEHPDEPRVMMPVPIDGVTDRRRYRLLPEGTIADFDGVTIPTPGPAQGLDLNRNFPAGWDTSVPGRGDHPLSEPEIDALVRAISARPNICGTNAYHTYGGVLLRPSSTKPDSALPPLDVWVWKQLAARGTELTGYRAHSCYEDFTWDKSATMSGAADDWAYEHLGVYGWTTEFWDPIAAATGERAGTDIWYVGPTVEQQLAVARWADEHAPGGYVAWYPYDHPQLGPVELGGADFVFVWTNPPTALLRQEVAPHAEFAVFHALASPRLVVHDVRMQPLGGDTWRVQAAVANTGWLPTDVTAWARTRKLVLPATVEILGDVEILGGTARVQLGQLEGRSAARPTGAPANDGTSDRTVTSWVIRAPAGTDITIEAVHPRAGRHQLTVSLTDA